MLALAATLRNHLLLKSGTAVSTVAPSHSFCVFRGFSHVVGGTVVGISYMALNPALTMFHFMSGLEDSRK